MRTQFIKAVVLFPTVMGATSLAQAEIQKTQTKTPRAPIGR